MNILFVSDVSISEVIGGAERVLYEQATGLARRGHDVHILTRKLPDHKSNQEIIQGVREWRSAVLVFTFSNAPAVCFFNGQTNLGFMRGSICIGVCTRVDLFKGDVVNVRQFRIGIDLKPLLEQQAFHEDQGWISLGAFGAFADRIISHKCRSTGSVTGYRKGIP